MAGRKDKDLKATWAGHDQEWRDPQQICSNWDEADKTDPGLLSYEVSGTFWSTLEALGVTILVTREYEHLVMAVGSRGGRPNLSFLRLPHPSGLAVDRKRGLVHIASTRNPNQVFDFAPFLGALSRLDARGSVPGRPLLPVRSRYLPGSIYLHDLAIVGGKLYGNAVGQNAVVELPERGGFRRAWWPRSIERNGTPLFDRNHLQLNSIAAGKDLKSSYFTSSSETVGRRRPGHRNFPVDGTGVIFSGRTRQVVVRGLTRPHSARLYQGKLWVDNSGYGEFGCAENGQFASLLELPGWTRGLCFYKDTALVGTSRVIPGYERYAPGLRARESRCGLHLIDMKAGRLIGSLLWPYGNQIFAIEAVPRTFSTGFPFSTSRAKRQRPRTTKLFSSFDVGSSV